MQYVDQRWYRHVCAVGAVFNIMTMMSANLVGFVVGTDGISYMLQQVLGTFDGAYAANSPTSLLPAQIS